MRRLFLFTLGAALFLGGCSSQHLSEKTLRVAVESDASTLDPAYAYDTSSIPFVRLLYRGLVDYDEKAGIVDEVAQSHLVSQDGKVYWFKLRPDVRFHHDEATRKTPGRRVVADDFRFAIQRILDPATASDGLALSGYHAIDGATAYSEACKELNKKIDAANGKPKETLQKQKAALRIKGIEVKGEDEIIFRLKKADATFFNYLALPFAYAVPHESVEKWGKDFRDHPNGCGPFTLERWVHDATLTLVKNPHYYNPEFPKSDRIYVEIGNSPTLQIMRFERGEVDMLDISAAFPPDFLRLRDSKKWQGNVLHGPMMDIRYMCLNNELPPLDNVLVRRAMNYAIKRERIASFLAGRATIARGALPPGMPGYNNKLFRYDYNPDKAKALLKQANYQDKPMTLWYSTREGWYEKAAQSIQQDLKAVGMTIDLKGVRYPELKAQAGKRKNLHLSLMGWLQDFPDPSNFLDVLFNEASITPTASQNRAFYSNPKVNQLLNEALTESNRPRRLQMYQEAEKIIVDDAPWVFLHHTERYVVHQPWITGYTIHPMWSERYEFVGVNR
ncbi:MAG TPA: ABC transporter substrate-binding protein [Abditibacteriaceae bacterium]